MFGLYTQQEADLKRAGEDAFLQQLRAEQGASTSSIEVKEHDAEKGQSRYLMGLFGGSPAKLSAKIAGLPKPENCL